MPKSNFATAVKVVELLPAAADAAGRSSDIISLKNATFATILVLLTQGNAAPVTLTLMQAQDVAGTGAKPFDKPIPIWANLDTAASDTLVRQPDGVSYASGAAVKNKQVVFHIDPAQLDVNGGYKTVFVTTSASNAANLNSILAMLEGHRYQAATLPSAIID
ncbi:hypothetical protein [Methylobacterium sp. CM6247]